MRLCLLVAVLAAACAPGTGAAGDRLEAVATVYPLAWVVEQVAPEAELTTLSSAGQDPHDLELTPQQRALLERADVVASVGMIGFQPQVEAALESAGGEVVDAAAVAGESRLAHIPDSDAVDPHLWFDPALMADVAAAVGEAFAAADPTRAADYRARADDTASELRRLTDELGALLRDCRHDRVIVSHEAYAYLLGPHGLEQHGISGAAGHAEASPQDIVRLADEIRSLDIPAVLSEPIEGRNDAEVVAAEAGVELLDIYSLDIVDAAQAAEGFPTLLREQAAAVATAAACGEGSG